MTEPTMEAVEAALSAWVCERGLLEAFPRDFPADAPIRRWMRAAIAAAYPKLVSDSLEHDGLVVRSYAMGEVTIDRARQTSGPDLWAVRKHSSCLAVSGGWEYEPLPSSRTEEWLAEHRFATAKEAIDAARAALASAGKESSDARA